jgi:hypothetical protein
MDDPIEITDLEAFIEGLKTSFDSLEDAEPNSSQGFQAQLAKAISKLRLKKMARTEKMPEHLGHVTKADLKQFFLNELKYLNQLLESNEFNNRKKFELVMKIAKLREKINNF